LLARLSSTLFNSMPSRSTTRRSGFLTVKCVYFRVRCVFDGHPRVVCCRPDANGKNAGVAIGSRSRQRTDRQQQRRTGKLDQVAASGQPLLSAFRHSCPSSLHATTSSVRPVRQIWKRTTRSGRGTCPAAFSGHSTKANGIVTEIFAKPCIQKLFWKVETIEIKVIPVYPRNHINFNQCIGRAFYRPDMAAARNMARTRVVLPAPRSPSSQTTMPGASRGASWRPKLAVASSSSAGAGSRGLVIIRAMHEGDSQTGGGSRPGQGQTDYAEVVSRIKNWGQELGFAAIGIASADVHRGHRG
jgi:hypothetical protein